jgi:hypothetical protein
MTAILEITDGTTTISLLNGEFGYYTDEWKPAIAQPKGGGTWQSSPMADGRKMVMRQWNNVSERFLMKVADANQDSAIEKTQELRRLLDKAAAFSLTDWQTTPVYLKAQAACETNPRYAIIKSWGTPDDENPLAQPFLQPQGRAVMDNWLLIIERAPFWLASAPQAGAGVAASALEAYDGRNLGNVDSAGTRDPTTANEVFVGNRRIEANLSDIYVNNGGVFGGNLLDAALPYNLLPAVPAAGDAVYFGIDTTLADSGYFANLVFDIGTAANDITLLVWEYWDGGAWAGLAVTNGLVFNTAAVGSVHWIQPADWTAYDLSGEPGGPAITAYWVRARVSVIGVAPSAPAQQNRNVYSCIWPYAEIQAVAIAGDTAALTSVDLHNRSYSAAVDSLDTSHVVCGLRSMSRGIGFTAYLNAADEQNPASVTVTTGANSSFIDVGVLSGRAVRYNPVGAEALARRVTFDLDSTVAGDFYGLYHAYVRAAQVGGTAGDIGIALRLQTTYTTTDTTVFTSGEVFFDAINTVRLLDIGRFDILTGLMSEGEGSFGIKIDIMASNSEAGTPGDATIYDLILMPVDEWAGDFQTPVSFLITDGLYLNFGSVENFKRTIRAVVKEAAADGLVSPYRVISNGDMILQSNSQQRLWFVAETSPAPGSFVPQFQIVHSLQIRSNERYFSMRGSR